MHVAQLFHALLLGKNNEIVEATLAIFEYLSDCATAFGTRKPMLIPSTKAVILIILSLIILYLMAALIARYPFAVAARSPL